MMRRAGRTAARLCAVAAAAAQLGGCELREITLAVPADLVIAEVVLQAGSPVQTALLHRTVTSHGSARVFDALVTVHPADGSPPIAFHAAADSLCLRPAPAQPPPPTIGTCYVATGPADMVRPGERYRLEVALPDGGRLAGTTLVPAAFELVAPAVAQCRLEPGTTLQLVWTRAEGAAAYTAAARLHGLVEQLNTAGAHVVTSDSIVDLLGVAIGAADTTMAFPGAFGVFDRFDESSHALLLAIRDGIPAGVRAGITVAAADGNYVNWVRGSSFNPSGTVRIPSVHGAGTGVFGSMLRRSTELHTGATTLPPCR
jgi:hypothetical protein